MKVSLLYCLIIILFSGCNSSKVINKQEVQNINTVSQISLIRDVSSNGLTINELEAIINDAEKQGNVGARSHIHQYWQLADLYIINKEYRKAYNIIINGLRLDSWNYKYQKIASEIEIMNHEYDKAYNRLNFIINNLDELGNIYNDSLQQIQSINFKNIDKQPINLPGYYVYIATYPNLNSDVIDVLSARISEEYGIEVKIINIGLDESNINMRGRQLEIYNEIIEDIYLKNSKEVINNFLQQIGLSNNEMNTLEGKRRFVYALLNQNENGRSQWAEIEMIKSQYSGNALLEQLSQRFKNYINDVYCLGVLGVTKNDIYENDYNFLFGWTQKKLGVMSYYRFLLGNPTNEQFEKRTVMQAFSSVGFIIGIPRCTNPNCARAYPNSLEEQDRKDDELCNECKENLRQVYKKYK
jgi:predicted Zn-dependent protease